MTAALDPAAREPRDLTALSDTQLERFARHLSLDGFGPEAQLALLRSRVLVVGAIPILGQILGNGQEGGLIGITYRLSGAMASPTLVVNPISAIAPGIFRQIFAFD